MLNSLSALSEMGPKIANSSCTLSATAMNRNSVLAARLFVIFNSPCCKTHTTAFTRDIRKCKTREDLCTPRLELHFTESEPPSASPRFISQEAILRPAASVHARTQTREPRTLKVLHSGSKLSNLTQLGLPNCHHEIRHFEFTLGTTDPTAGTSKAGLDFPYFVSASSKQKTSMQRSLAEDVLLRAICG